MCKHTHTYFDQNIDLWQASSVTAMCRMFHSAC